MRGVLHAQLYAPWCGGAKPNLTLLLDYQLSMLAEDALSTIIAREEIATVAPQLLNAEEKRSWELLAQLLEKKLAPTLFSGGRRRRGRGSTRRR